MSRCGGFCEMLGPRCSMVATAVDHIVPVAEGGTDELDNLQGVCPECHEVKTQEEAARGVARRSRWRAAPAHPFDKYRT